MFAAPIASFHAAVSTFMGITMCACHWRGVRLAQHRTPSQPHRQLPWEHAGFAGTSESRSAWKNSSALQWPLALVSCFSKAGSGCLLAAILAPDHHCMC